MSDTYSINIQPGTVSITRTADNSVIFSTNYNYLHQDPSGTILWPVQQTMSSSGGNLTWQFNGQQIVIQNKYYAAGAKAFDTYVIPMKALNPSITTDNFTDYQAANEESTSNAV
jgi:hypothetical protein